MNHPNDPTFRTTQWTVVLQAQAQESQLALDQLCQRYWYPLYAFVRRKGHGAEEAKDLTQEFFAQFLEKHWLKSVNQERGKFRTFLMMAMKRFLANQRNHQRRLKRGGNKPPLSLDAIEAEERFAAEALLHEDPSLLYDRGWALTLIKQCLAQLEKEQEPQKFQVLRSALVAGTADFDCAQAAETLGMSEGATRVAVHRLRKRYREIFRYEIAQTLSDPADFDKEINHLIEILSKG